MIENDVEDKMMLTSVAHNDGGFDPLLRNGG